MKKLVLACCVLLLTACGSKLDGTYADQMGMSKYTFKSNGKVVVDTFGFASELLYEVDGDKLKIDGPQGNMLLTIKDDGTINGPMGIVLKKSPK